MTRKLTSEQIQALDIVTQFLRNKEEFESGFRRGFVVGWVAGSSFIGTIWALVWALQ